MVHDLVNMVALNPHDAQSWMIPVKKTEAVRDVGMTELLDALQAHQTYLTHSGKRKAKAREFLKTEIIDILSERLNHSIMASFDTTSGKDVLEQVFARTLDPYKAADLISGV